MERAEGGGRGGEPVFYVRFDFYSSHDILRMFEQDLEYERKIARNMAEL